MSIVPQLVANSIIAGALYAMLALGFNLIFSTVKFFDIGYGVMTVVGGYTVFFLTSKAGVPLLIAIAAAMLFTGLVGYLVYRLVYAPLRARHASNMVMLVASLGVLTMIQAVVAITFGSQFQPLGNATVGTLIIGGAAITYTQLWVLGSAILLMGILGLVLKRTMFGQAVRAISDNEEVARIVGINTKRVISKVFFIGSAIGGLSGIFWGLDTGIEPTSGLALLLKAIIAAIIGGVGNVYAGVLGAFILGFAENFGIWKISGEWKDAIAFGLLILFLIFRPKGLIQTK